MGLVVRGQRRQSVLNDSSRGKKVKLVGGWGSKNKWTERDEKVPEKRVQGKVKKH